MKKIRILIILIIFASAVYLAGTSLFAEEEPLLVNKALYAEPTTKEEVVLPEKVLERFIYLDQLSIDASSVILLNAETGHIIFEKNSHTSLPTASMSKMMTELLVLEAIDEKQINWDTEITISEYSSYISSQPGFASVHLQEGKEYTVEQLFDAMAIHSANGAAIALAEAVSGSELTFVEEMNARAEQLGLKDTSFVNSTGLSNKDLDTYYSVGTASDTNRMSATDVAVLAQYLITTYPDILQVVNQSELLFENQVFTNTNWLLPDTTDSVTDYQGVDGLKTGYTEEAGYCFTGTVEQQGVRLISVVMGTSSIESRFIETEKLYNQAFPQYLP
ncbi:D-alanyl-D-alanine carboxypeptidase [Gracilibacillus caseinilyticus]|uniref:D-alanyl-D-alanine carboxypeptidase n=1 Tax=Gracilibacillus caseinilyticus TaxID=2932256 RepID=A0ABY4EYH2_9BACI|nr:D-alanyl-D-alanine carboxypeptidase family protein [Gracilibacillus caseinilyticus]UOQ48903.1 D-alanyl-D-alanine carboxypeptidase [Gracilibacillus caseinilyticus]